MDIFIIRELAKRYADIAADPRNDELRRLWSDHLSLRPTRVPVHVLAGGWDAWFGEWLGGEMSCEAPVLREIEWELRSRIRVAEFGDDTIFEPWLACGAVNAESWDMMWGVRYVGEHLSERGSAFKPLSCQFDLDDLSQLRPPAHVFDEEATQRKAAVWHDALDGILPFEVTRRPMGGIGGDLATALIKLRGIEQSMADMIEHPEALHRLLAFLRDGFLARHATMAAVGDWTRALHCNQVMPYAHELPPPAANGGPVPMSQLWHHFFAQEFTGISPAMHEEFILQYQRPIIEQFGLVTYGCCEDLSHKIDILRSLPNLRIITVSPMLDTAGLARCAEQIGTDYAISWRPSPAEYICNSWNPERLERTLRAGFEVTRGTRRHIHINSVHTVQGDPSRIRKFCNIARRLSEEYE